MASVLLVSIGPVQDFIASARRCGDLWYGSWLLSELAKAAADGIVEASDGKRLDALVFPGATARASLSPGSDTAVANKLLVHVPTGASAKDLAEAGREAMKRRLEELATEAFAGLGATDPDKRRYFDEERAWAQVRDLVEYTWVAVAEDAHGGYAGARREAERLLDARKGTKLWAQPTWSDTTRKSSLDGARESVLREELFRDARGKPADAERLRRDYGVRATERLCGVGVLKRAGVRENSAGHRERARFFSTPHVAALPLMQRCRGEGAAFEKYARVLREVFGRAADAVLEGAPRPFEVFGHADGQIFFGSRLAELAAESATPEAGTTGLRRAQTALAAFCKETKTREPAPYYALLLADGDRMGRAIDAATTLAQHRALSLRLAEFADAAAKVVSAHHGSLIYAGGDDVLALVPLHTAVACASALQLDFAHRLSAFTIPGGGSPTLSVGLGVSHFIEPLDGALAVARRSERLAKTARNSLAIIVEKRGGSPVEVTGPWVEPDGASPLPARLEAMVGLLRRDEVPDKVGFELAALAAELGKSNPDLIAAEVRRVLGRKQSHHGRDATLAKETLAQLKEWAGKDPTRLADELFVARLLAAARDVAEGPLETQPTPQEAFA